jgi:FtsH-binding integral membrane protein
MEKEKKKNWLTSLFTDKDWDFDITKVLGFGIVVAGLVGFFLEKSDFQWIIAFGSGLIATGKFSKEG